MATPCHSRRCLVENLEARQLLAVDVAVTTTQRFQTIDGFGTSVAWYSETPYNSNAWRDMYYQDLGSSMLRVDVSIQSLAGPDNNIATPVTLVDDINTNIAMFNLGAPGVSNVGAVANSSITKRLDGFRMIGSLWTPPHWMKGPELDPVTGLPNGNNPVIAAGGQDSAGGSLIDTPANLQQFGRYVAAYVKGFQQTYGVPFDSISIQNEPAFHEPYNSCVYTPALYVKALKAVADAFDYYNIDCKLIGPEDVGVGATNSLDILQRQFRYIDAIRNDPIAFADLEIYALHGYANDPVTPNRSPTMWGQYWNGRPAGQFPSPNWTGISGDGKKSYQTEAAHGSHNWTTGAIRICVNAMDALTIGNVNAWLYWQTGVGTTNTNGTLTVGTDTTDKNYNAAKHYFRYIRPGAVRVNTTPSNPTGIYSGAFIHDSNRTLTVVIVNAGTTADTVNLSTLGTQISSFNIARRTSAAETWLDLGTINFSGGIASVSAPAQSIITLQGTIGADTTRPTVAAGAFDFETAHKVRLTFSENVAASLVAADLQVQNLTSPGTVVSASSVSYDSATNVATFSFSPALLPDGNYRVTLPAGSVADASGNTLLSNYTLDFFALAGDATRNRSINSADFNILATNFGTNGKTFSQGNFSYDANGDVNSADFNILATNFGTTLPGADEQSRGGASGSGSSAGGVGASGQARRLAVGVGDRSRGSLFSGSGRVGDDDESDNYDNPS